MNKNDRDNNKMQVKLFQIIVYLQNTNTFSYFLSITDTGIVKFESCCVEKNEPNIPVRFSTCYSDYFV